MSRYDWRKAPEWANYAATDSNGGRYCFECKPKPNETDGTWHRMQGRYIHIKNSFPDWEESLEKRPKMVKRWKWAAVSESSGVLFETASYYTEEEVKNKLPGSEIIGPIRSTERVTEE